MLFRTHLLSLALLACLLTGCSGSTPPAAAPSAAPSPLPALPPTISQASTPVQPALPSATVSASPTWTATLTPTLASTPTPTPSLTITIAVIGDFGLAGKPLEDVANLIKSWQPDLVITTGDNNYPDGEASTIDQNVGAYFQQWIFPYTGQYGPGAQENRFFPTLGNHDWTAQHAQPYLDYFTLPGNERYYDFTWGPVHFFAIDADSREPDGVGASSIQASWLKERLAAAPEPWKLVYFHQAPYSSGTHGPVDWMRWPFADWGATAVLSGHDHIYERLQIGGIPYMVNGVGGGPIYDFSTPSEGSLVRFREDYGAQRILASPSTMVFQFFTRTGQLIDELILNQP